MRWGMVIDLRRCVGCQTCTIACKQEHGLPAGVQWRFVADCEVGEYPDVRRVFLPMQCMHCAEPPCVPVCPTGASRRREDGIVWVAYDACVGCGYCAVACPYHARHLVHEARGYFEGYVPGTNKKEYDSLQGVARSNLTPSSAINRLATHPEVLRVVSNYMGMLPILHRISVLYSANDEEVEKSSQFFHLDPEDVIMTKIFVYVEDVDRDTGPTTALPADRSTIVRRKIDYRNSRVPDDVIFDHGGKENLVECTGPAGTLLFAALLICWTAGALSAVVDNIPFVAVTIPIIAALRGELTGDTTVLWWALSLGACLGGNATIIGASANVTATGLAERAGSHVAFGQFSRFGVPVTVMTLVIASAWLALHVYAGALGTLLWSSVALVLLLVVRFARVRREAAAPLGSRGAA